MTWLDNFEPYALGHRTQNKLLTVEQSVDHYLCVIFVYIDLQIA